MSSQADRDQQKVEKKAAKAQRKLDYQANGLNGPPLQGRNPLTGRNPVSGQGNGQPIRPSQIGPAVPDRTWQDVAREGGFGKDQQSKITNLDGRQALFSEMKGQNTTGRSDEFRKRAANLGVDDKGWAAGIGRLEGREPAAAPAALPSMASAPDTQKPAPSAGVMKPVEFNAGIAKDNVAKMGVGGAYADYKARSAARDAGAPVITPKASMPNADEIKNGIAGTTITQPKLGVGAPKVGYDGKGYGQTWQQTAGLPKQQSPIAAEMNRRPASISGISTLPTNAPTWQQSIKLPPSQIQANAGDFKSGYTAEQRQAARQDGASRIKENKQAQNNAMRPGETPITNRRRVINEQNRGTTNPSDVKFESPVAAMQDRYKMEQDKKLKTPLRSAWMATGSGIAAIGRNLTQTY